VEFNQHILKPFQNSVIVNPNRADNATYTISHAAGSTEVAVNQQQNGSAWQLLGRFDFNSGPASVRLSDRANGYVIADALRFVPVGPVQAAEVRDAANPSEGCMDCCLELAAPYESRMRRNGFSFSFRQCSYYRAWRMF
jgi:hypothetical protein